MLQLEVVRLLIKAGADPSVTNIDGQDSLFVAAKNLAKAEEHYASAVPSAGPKSFGFVELKTAAVVAGILEGATLSGTVSKARGLPVEHGSLLENKEL
eukprot:SAG31_NODE_6642_length_1942_cov_1.176886_2_plen_98_part_00